MRRLLPLVLIALVLLAIAQQRGGRAAPFLHPPALAAGSSEKHVASPAAMEGKTLEAYREWSANPRHFGTFAVSNYGNYGWTTGHNSRESADRVALSNCGMPNCVIAARHLPAAQANDGQRIVARNTLDGYNLDFLARAGARAFAVHPNGAWGAAWGKPSLRSARQTALRVCAQHSRDEAPCEIVDDARF